MESNTKLILRKYYNIYQKLYKRAPGEMRMMENGFVLVNNMKIHITDLEQLTANLEEEYRSLRSKQKGNILRLINWLRS